MIGLIILGIIILIALAGIRIVEQTERGLVETFGKYARFANPGFQWIIPVVQSMRKIDITENLVDAEPQVIQTKDKLNAKVDAQVYYKVKDTENDVKASQYNVANYEDQIVNLTRTTLRNVIGTITFREANSDRKGINKKIMATLIGETKSWGIQFTRAELKEIEVPEDVQQTMNSIIKAENEKIAAVDFAVARETEADGYRKAAIKKAEGEAQAVKINANAQAEAIKLVNQAAHKHFKGNAQKLKQLEVTQASLEKNSKIILTEKGIKPTILIGSGKIEV